MLFCNLVLCYVITHAFGQQKSVNLFSRGTVFSYYFNNETAHSWKDAYNRCLGIKSGSNRRAHLISFETDKKNLRSISRIFQRSLAIRGKRTAHERCQWSQSDGAVHGGHLVLKLKGGGFLQTGTSKLFVAKLKIENWKFENFDVSMG